MVAPAISGNSLRSGTIVRGVAIVFGFLYALKLAGVAVSILIVGFLGILFGLNLSALADALQKKRVPRAVTAGGAVILLLMLLGVGGTLLGPSLRKQGAALREQLPTAVDKLDARLQRMGITLPTPKPSSSDSSAVANGADSGRVREASDSSNTREPPDTAAKASGGNLRAHLDGQMTGLASKAAAMLSSTASALAGVFIVLFIAVFYTVEPKIYRNGVLHLLPLQHRERVGEAMSATGTVLRRWLSAQFLAMLCVGALSTVAYMLIGLDAAVALGVIAGLCEFVPFVGPVVAAVPAIGMALADSPEKALYVLGISVGIQQAEEVLIIPLLMKNNLKLPPILTILAQGAMGAAFGILGLLVAVPVLAAAMVLVKLLYVRDVLGDDMDEESDGAQKAHA